MAHQGAESRRKSKWLRVEDVPQWYRANLAMCKALPGFDPQHHPNNNNNSKRQDGVALVQDPSMVTRSTVKSGVRQVPS
jgi:hypothetical protein